MRNVFWKCLAVLPLLCLTLWWILADPPAAPGTAPGQAGATGIASGTGIAGATGIASAAAAAELGTSAEGARTAAAPLAGGPGSLGIGSGPGIDPAIPADSAAAGDPAWRRAPLWDDGKAEFCAYEVSWAHYGHVYQGRALLVLVKEPWNPALDVKADHPGHDSFDVLKLNQVRDVATGIYTYHQMASLFWRRDSGALQKLAATSSEACGISYAEMTRGRLQTHDYFDGQGDRVQRWPPLAFPEDGLPAALRAFVTGILPPAIEVFPSLLAARYPDLAPRSYRLERRAAPGGATPAAGGAGGEGGGGGAVELRLTSGASRLTYTFAAALPHRLLRFEREDGTVYRLAKCERLPYWEMHDPGGESWLPAAVR
ncbi:MAG TPA: hypothetical protein VKY89_15415 [Thermoanaerobaculia bacterium]|jgi:hypothetical protein|nr:hypothetical protein [Thermoanaerobaculia bacterium]